MLRKQTALLILFLLIFLQVTSCGETTSTSSTLPGPATGDEYDLDLSIELMLLSLVAYEQRTQCIDSGKDAITVPDTYTLVEVYFETVDPSTDDSCKDDTGKIPIAYIATKDDRIYLVFRGTATPTEEVLDAEISQVEYTFVDNGGMTETGFTGLYSQINDAIIAKITELINSGDFSTISVTGHSLGAALAVLVIPELANQSATLTTVMYSFAGPAVGNTDFKDLYNGSIETSFRVANTNDVIPKLPPLELENCPDIFYTHVNEQESITFGTEISGFPDFSSTCSIVTIELTLGIFLDANKAAVEENHSSCNYYSTLCDMTSDPDTCRDNAKGIHGCFE